MNSKGGLVSHKLNLGCGADIKEGWVNLDITSQPGVDVVHDLEKIPLPFADNSFEEILCQDILEHVDYMPLLQDLHRILMPGGMLHVRVPHYTSRNNYTDPTHKKRFSISTFDYFAEGTHVWKHRRGAFNFTTVFKALRDTRINFDKKSSFLLRINYPVEALVNRNHRTQLVYEMTGLSWLFPAADITVTLIK